MLEQSVMNTVHEVDRMGMAAIASSTSTIVNPVRRGPILLALHGATSSPAAISTAQLIANRLGLDVEVVSVTAAEQTIPSPLDIMPEPRRSRRERNEHHEGVMRSALRHALVIDPTWSVSVRHGPPAREVALQAQAIDATMIIVNSTPGAGILRTTAGIFATELARRCTCPVLAVTSPLPTLPQRIVAAVDFSPASIRAVQAAALVADDHAVVTLLHMPVPIRFSRPHLDQTGAPIGADVTSLFDRLEAEILPYAPEGITVQRVVADGSTPSAILDRARAESADLIVAGTHGPNLLERFFVGSTAVTLLHLSSCAVLIAPAPASGEVLSVRRVSALPSRW
jgi:universal stress protein E